jgi:hypothetical protein
LKNYDIDLRRWDGRAYREIGPTWYTAVSKVKVNSSPALMAIVSVPLLIPPPTLHRRSFDARSVTGAFWSQAGFVFRRTYFHAGAFADPTENCWKM